MAVKEFSKSMKAKMYNFTYTPFMSSMVISWIILNHKYILIYMASIKDFNEKLNLLDNFDFSLWGIPYMHNAILPILFGLFYTFIYPKISKYFYQYTLNRTKELKTIKKDIEDKTPITEEEAREYKEQFILMSAEIQELRAQLSDANKLVLEKNTNKKEISQQVFSIDKPESKTNISQKQEEDDKTKILRYFYESNYTRTTEGNVLNNLFNQTNIARPKAQKIINLLINEKIITRSHESGKYIDLTDIGNEVLLKLFDKETKNK